jgi:hypothetical protein
MAIKTVDQFRLTKLNGDTTVVCAAKISDAVLMVESETVEIIQADRVASDISVDVPDADVMFNVTVSPDSAGTAGCIALPKTFIVPAGTSVILQAVPASTYTFLGWYRGVTLLSADAIAEIAIASPVAGTTADEIVAKFQTV